MNSTSNDAPGSMDRFVRPITFGTIGDLAAEVAYEDLGDGLMRVAATWTLTEPVAHDDLRVVVRPAFEPDFHWSPHVTPSDDHIIAQHVFRAPALLMASRERQLTLVPDLITIGSAPPELHWYLDVDAPAGTLSIGISRSKPSGHVRYRRAPGTVFPAGTFTLAFYLMGDTDETALANPWRRPAEFLWERHGRPAFASGAPRVAGDLDAYVEHTYGWAFERWPEVWQQFELEGVQVGAPAFIVNVTQSPNHPGPVDEREFRSIWNQAWFNSLRSAQGVFRYGRRTGNPDLLERARMTKELALRFPRTQGFFFSVVGTGMGKEQHDGRKVRRSRGWDTRAFGNSNRNPQGGWRDAPFHVLDMSYTAWLMLTWYEELERDERLLAYATEYAEALLSIQDAEGFFPAWLDQETLKPSPILAQSPETSQSVTFLLKLHAITGEPRYRAAALQAMDAVLAEIVPTGRWEDFETYWSCSTWGSTKLVGRKVARNDMYKQNTFSMYWTAEALLRSFETTGDGRYLESGRRTLDELLMAQAVWQPPYIHVDALGGFGVMNADAEWNDSRQSLFAGLIIEYGTLLESREYIERGLAALHASFVMMYCPENPRTREQWEKRWPFFGPSDYGFTMENYGHDGVTSAEGRGMGEFTIYDWGNGAAAEAYNRAVDLHGKDFVNAVRA